MLKKTLAIAITVFMICSLAACSKNVSDGDASNTTSAVSTDAAVSLDNTSVNLQSENTSDTVQSSAQTVSYTVNTNGHLDTSDLFTDRDLNQTADTSSAKTVSVADGQTINITEEGNYTINNNVTMENIYYNTFPGENIEYPYTVPENSYFIMNDYRDNINDSRTYGAINIKDIEGPVFLDLRRRGF